MLAATALILAGGRASRLGGIAKHAIMIDGEAILARQLRIFAPRCAEVIVALAPGAPAIAGVTCVHDATAHGGPLAGIAAGLTAARMPWCLLAACDMPDLSAELVDRILAERGDHLDAVGVRVAGVVEPLVGALRVAPARARVAELLAGGVRKASQLWDVIGHVAWLDDADPRALRNINTPEDLGPR